MERLINECMQVLDLIPLEKRQSTYECSMFEYLKGRLFNVSLDYTEEAEYHLTQATNLNPSFLDAWSCLGCLIKKRDYTRARSCFQFALSMAGGDFIVLYQLADLELMVAPGAADPSEHINECFKHVQKALTLDDKDVDALHVLGGAYIVSFLVTGGWNINDLLLSLEALEKAVENDAKKSSPNLQFDYAVVNRFLENYKRSLTGFLDSASTDPASGALKQMQLMLQLLDKLERLVQGNSDDKSEGKSKGKNKGKNKGKSKAKNKGKSKETSLSSLIESLATVDLNSSFNQATIDLLTEGINKGVAVIGKVRCLVKSEIQAPLYYLLYDSDQNSFVLTVFGIQKEAIKQGDQVTLLEPFCNFVDFEWQGKHYQFKSLRVNLLEQVLVNGNALSPDLAIRKSIHPESKA